MNSTKLKPKHLTNDRHQSRLPFDRRQQDNRKRYSDSRHCFSFVIVSSPCLWCLLSAEQLNSNIESFLSLCVSGLGFVWCDLIRISRMNLSVSSPHRWSLWKPARCSGPSAAASLTFTWWVFMKSFVRRDWEVCAGMRFEWLKEND